MWDTWMNKMNKKIHMNIFTNRQNHSPELDTQFFCQAFLFDGAEKIWEDSRFEKGERLHKLWRASGRIRTHVTAGWACWCSGHDSDFVPHPLLEKKHKHSKESQVLSSGALGRIAVNERGATGATQSAARAGEDLEKAREIVLFFSRLLVFLEAENDEGPQTPKLFFSFFSAFVFLYNGPRLPRIVSFENRPCIQTHTHTYWHKRST